MTNDAAFATLLGVGGAIAEGDIWFYQMMSMEAGIQVQHQRSMLDKLRGYLERQGHYFIVERGVGWRRCTARDMLLWDAREFAAVARRAQRAIKRLRCINPLELSDTERSSLIKRIGLWTLMREEALEQAAMITKKARRMRHPKPQPSYPPIHLPYLPS